MLSRMRRRRKGVIWQNRNEADGIMRVLILYHAGYTYTPTIQHYLTAFKRHSIHSVEYFNVDQSYGGLDFSGYDVVYVNFCIASAGIARVKPPKFMYPLIAALRRYSGLKIVAAQDEYDFTNKLKEFLVSIRTDVLLTCVPQVYVREIYPEPELAGVKFRTVQTAYLADDLLEVNPADILPLADRAIHLGYRGRNLPYRLGDLGWHKSEVGVQFKRACVEAGVVHDIEVAEEKRFVGDDWLRFVRQCRVMLGSPSGANIFDLDGALHERMTALYRATPGLMYEDVRDEISAYETGRDMGQVSARIFEAVAQGTALALVRGNYSGVLEPDEHYVPIETDYSNVGQVLDRILDVPAMQAMADRAYQHVVNNSRNRFSDMVAGFDRLINENIRPVSHSGVRLSRVTTAPLGCDLYLMEQIIELRTEYRFLADRFYELLKLSAENQLEVIAHPDGTYRMLKHPVPQQHDSDWEALVDAGVV